MQYIKISYSTFYMNIFILYTCIEKFGVSMFFLDEIA